MELNNNSVCYVYNLNKNNKYLNTFSHLEIIKHVEFTDEIKNDKPLLIIGYNKAKELFNIVNIENNHIEKNIYWTYSSDEYLNYFLKGFEKFLNSIVSYYNNIIEYKNVNVFFDKIYNYTDFEKHFCNEKYFYYRREKMLYCFSKEKNLIKSINLNELVWFEIMKQSEIIKYLQTDYIEDKKSKIFLQYKKLFPNDDIFLLERIIPILIYT
jgi:hypothetical protein